jgi:hypothetical protein
MPLSAFCEAAEGTAVGEAIRASTWLFPTIETTHLVAMVLLVGSITAFDLRLLGLAMRCESVSHLAERLLPCTWSAFGVMIVTGALMFTSDAVVKYCFNPALGIKLLLMVLAGVNMALFHFTIYRRVAAWDKAGTPPLSAKLVGSFSVLLWASVVCAGRWIGFV